MKEKKPYYCDICEVTFGNKKSLNSHYAAVHDGKKPKKCEVKG